MLQLLTLLCFVALCTSVAQAKVYLHPAGSRRDALQLIAATVELPLDHFNAVNTATFSNRYWVNSDYYKPGGPVIFFDAGETDASEDAAFITTDAGQSNTMIDLAERFGALLILWEHRYYGKSLPAKNSNAQGTLDDVAKYYQYLTFEQALEDVAVFAKNFSLPSQPNTDFRPNKVPWVFIGGSYPGVRAAWMRLRNPEIIFASLSSSAPVELQEDFWQYWVAVERKLANTAGYESCLTDMHAMAQWATDVVAQRDVATAEAFLFNATSLNYVPTQDNTTQAWNYRMLQLSSVFQISTGDFQDLGLYGGLGKFCNKLKSSNYTNDASVTTADLQNGIFAYYGINRATEIYASVIYDLLVEKIATSQKARTVFEVSVNHVNGYLPGGFNVTDSLSWAWQTCLEAGFFQISNPSRATNIVPGFINLDAWIASRCTGQFGNTVAGGPNVATLNAKYGGWHLKASNIFSTNGQYDPWRALSVASDIDPSSPSNTLTTTIPPPNTIPANGAIFGYVVQEGVHTSDLNYNLTAVQTNTTIPGSNQLSANQAHEIFASALSSWLPAYTPFAASPVANATSAGTAATPTQSLTSTSGAAAQRLWKGAWVLLAVGLGLAIAC